MTDSERAMLREAIAKLVRQVEPGCDLPARVGVGDALSLLTALHGREAGVDTDAYVRATLRLDWRRT